MFRRLLTFDPVMLPNETIKISKVNQARHAEHKRAKQGYSAQAHALIIERDHLKYKRKRENKHSIMAKTEHT